MKVKSKISHLTYQDDARELACDIDLAIVYDWDKKYGIYDYQANAYVIEPEYDNIFKLGPSAFVVCKSAMQSLWIVRESRAETSAERFKRREVRRISEYELDRIYAERGLIVMCGYKGENPFSQVYSLESEWLSEPWDWIGIASGDLIIASSDEETVLMEKTGRILWQGYSPCMITPTDITISGDGRYPVFFDMMDGSHLWPVFQAVPVEDDTEYDEDTAYTEDNSFDLEICKYIRSKQEPKWCEEQQIYCPAVSGNMLGHTRY